MGGRIWDLSLIEERKQIGVSQLTIVADQFWLSWVEMVMNEMTVALTSWRSRDLHQFGRSFRQRWIFTIGLG